MSSLYRRGRIWWVKYRNSDGAIKRESLKTVRRGIALEAQKVIDRRLRKIKPLSSADLTELTETFLEIVKMSCSYGHYINTKSRVDSFIEDARINEPEEITVIKIQDYLAEIAAKKSSPSTIRGYRAAISAFCQFLCSRHIITENPCRHVKTPKITRLLPRFLTEKECEKALDLAKKHDIYLEILTALKTGMRLNELRQLCWEDIHWDKNLILIPKTKTNRPRSIPLNKELAGELRKVSKQSGPVFPGRIDKHNSGYRTKKTWLKLIRPLQEAIPAFTKDAGGNRTGRAYHLLRNTFASHLVQKGVDVYKVSKWLGHSNVTTTMRYAHLAPKRYDEDINKI